MRDIVRSHLTAFCWADGKITSPYVTFFYKAQYQYPAICACDEGRTGKICEGLSTRFPQSDMVRAPTSLCPPWPGPLQCPSVLAHKMGWPVSESKRRTKPVTKTLTCFFQF